MVSKIMLPYDAIKKQNKATLYMLFCFNIFNVDSIFENVDYSILFLNNFMHTILKYKRQIRRKIINELTLFV